MEEFIKYIKSLEQRLADLETGAKASAARIEALEARIKELETNEVNETSEPVEEPVAPEMPELTFDFAAEEPAEEPVEEPVEEPAEEDVLTLDEEETLIEEDNLEELEVLDGVDETVAPVAPAAPAAPAASEEDEVEAFRQKYASSASTRNDSLFHTPVEDIGRAMSLGDQFFFRHELFSDNGELMAKTIQTLNNAADYNEATRYIIKNFGRSWEQIDHATVSRFMDVVQRRFI